MGTERFGAIVFFFVIAALTALAWSLRTRRASEVDASPALSPGARTLARSDGAPEAISIDVAPAREVARVTLEVGDLGAQSLSVQEAAPAPLSSALSAPERWAMEYAAYSSEQLDDERRALLERVSRQKHAIGLEKLNRGEGVTMARGAQPDDAAFAPAPGNMTVFRSGPDGTGEVLWERVDLLEPDHPELFELNAKMGWVNQEWARRRDAPRGAQPVPAAPR